jgi:prepilin-type N-terminal cleavage/methylation domain-containing protein
MKILHKKAFSLIEISVVILIIGMLIAGISQGIDLYQDSRLASARALTQSSRVGRIADLVAWYETTSLKSIDSAQAVDGKEITTWFDINPNTTSPKNATQNTANRKPKYNLKNSLPLINFNGIFDGQFLNLPNKTIPFGDSNFTIFLVLQVSSSANSGHNDVLVAGKWPSAITLMRLVKQNTGFKFQNFSGVTSAAQVFVAQTTNLPLNQLTILTAKHTNSPSRLLTSYANSTQHYSASIDNNAILTGEDYNMIGGNSWHGLISGSYHEYFGGDIGEIIIYDRALTDNERKDVEKYLSKKWAIKIN